VRNRQPSSQRATFAAAGRRIDLEQGRGRHRVEQSAIDRQPETRAMTATLAESPLAALKIGCSSCNLRELCLPVGFSKPLLERLDVLVATRRPVRRGETLFRTGDRFEAVYAVRTGFFKTRVSSDGGRDQVTGFQMVGELLGLDGISTSRHTCDAVALEDSQVCLIPYAQLEQLSSQFPELQHQFHKILSREIVCDRVMMLLLGGMRAEERVAAFLLNITQRLEERGFSATSLLLRMTREEIGDYLGLKLETVSRCFSKLHDDGVLRVRQRHVQVLDRAALTRAAGRKHA
jgi:CRP/FNR family transcriptional regulator